MPAKPTTRAHWRNLLDLLIDAERALQRAEAERDAALSAFLDYQPPVNEA